MDSQKHCGSYWKGLTRSEEKARVPPLKGYIWQMASDTFVDEESYMVNMTDGAAVYVEPHPGIQEHYSVNHSEHEWSRPENVLMNCDTGETSDIYLNEPLGFRMGQN